MTGEERDTASMETSVSASKDPKQYPNLRNLQYSPLKHGDEQFIVLWDPTGLSQERLVIPLHLFYLFQFFDGEHSLEQIGVEYLKKYGEFLMPNRLVRLIEELDAKLFLEGERCEQAKAAARAAYSQSPRRSAAFAGRSYEADPEKLRAQLEGFFTSKEGPGTAPSVHAGQRIRGLVAPSYEVKEAGPLYAWAYKELREARTPDVFVLVGTCHAGLEQGIAVTSKDFETPLGVVPVHRPLLEALNARAGEMFYEEELRHQAEHSLEFQLPFLQYTVGVQKPFSIVPVLGAFPPTTFSDPALHVLRDRVELFITSLQQAIQDLGQDVCIIASANLAHIGLRYGDRTAPTDFSFHRCMQKDLEMLKHVEQRDHEAFTTFLLAEQDKRHVWGFPALYLFLRLVQADTGEVLRYDRGITDQFNSTVTYASMAFY
ncbi:MAG: AmmeMemoRadiSam system protein B [Nitrospirae bacterium]|nr:MAG: AmmeMemoRadiSam system protein B [Nitrospirota bacterium]